MDSIHPAGMMQQVFPFAVGAAEPSPPPPQVVAEPPSLADILALEPSLGLIIEAARQLRYSDWGRFEELKSRAAQFVGWYARRTKLRSYEAYETVIRAIADAMGGGHPRRHRRSPSEAACMAKQCRDRLRRRA